MDSPSDKKSPTALWVGLGALLVLALAILARVRPPDGNEHASLAQYFGRFHPVVVHLPIGLILLAALMEAASGIRRWTHLRPAVGFVLALAAACAIGAALDGWLLAWSGAYKGALVTRHMWGGVWLAALSLLTAGVRAASARRPGWVGFYRLLLLCCVVLLAWTSHEGGSLTHGEGYLTEYLPGRLRSLLGIAPPKSQPAAAPASAAAATFYAVRLAPLFERSCLSCHGPKKVKGGLRLDTYALLMKGGEDGPALVAWYPQKSEIIRRTTLPPDDDDFMPSNGKNAFSPAEVKLLEQWIASGASDQQPSDVPLAK